MNRISPMSLASLAALALYSAATIDAFASDHDAPEVVVPNQSSLDLVNALHAAFGEHHARAVHTKGVMLEGTFTPAKEARTLTKAPIFAGGELPVVARFSLFAGVPDLPDNSDGASPAGFAVKIKEADGGAFDVEANQHNNFILPTADEFAAFLRALGASGAGVPHPTPVEKFLSTRPGAQQFLATRTYPVSYATAAFFGVNSIKLTNASGKSVFARYKYVPRAGEHYLTPEERKAKGPNYLQDDIVERVGQAAVVFDWYAQIAESGDKIEDPSIAWPDTRRFVKLGTIALTRRAADEKTAEQRLLFLPGQSHPGVEPADPMLILRNAAYPISLGQRQ